MGDTTLATFRTLALSASIKRAVLVATDVAARGLDITGVNLVLIYDFGRNGTEAYVHRIGRTGRVDRAGKAISFFTPNDRTAPELCDLLTRAGQRAPKKLQLLAQREEEQRRIKLAWLEQHYPNDKKVLAAKAAKAAAAKAAQG